MKVKSSSAELREDDKKVENEGGGMSRSQPRGAGERTGFKTGTATVAVKTLGSKKTAPAWGLIRRLLQQPRQGTEVNGSTDGEGIFGADNAELTVTDCRWTNSDLDHWMAPKQGRRGGTFDSPGQEVSSRQP